VDAPTARALTQALLEASMALVAVAARSLDDLDDRLTLPQYRTLVVLHSTGPLSTTALAEQVGVHQSTATRVTARLQRQGLVSRRRAAQDRRLVVVQLTAEGERLVDDVMQRRARELERVVHDLGARDAEAAVAALQTFSAAVGRLPEGWKPSL
jgi:DNA-binding MarR family transcriptional regulator